MQPTAVADATGTAIASGAGGTVNGEGNSTGGGTGAGGSGSGGTGRSDSSQSEAVSPQAAPTYAPGLANSVATVTAMTPAPLANVQQTAQSSLQGTPEVIPSLSYGPNIAFTHTFPHAGMYRCWLEVQYRGQIVTVNYTFRVVD